jgi:hypothetical protein
MQGIDRNTIIEPDRHEDSKRIHVIFKLKLPADTVQWVLNWGLEHAQSQQLGQ